MRIPITAKIIPLFMVVSTLLMGGCEVTKDHHGCVMNEDSLKMIIPHKTQQRDVQTLLGLPSYISPHMSNQWYYLSHITAHQALSAPWVQECICCAITFNQSGHVSTIEISRVPKQFAHATETTQIPSLKEDGFLKKMFFNIARFDAIRPMM